MSRCGYLSSKLDYEDDHHRKLEFIPENCSWKETNKNVSDMITPVLIRYEGFPDRQIIHIYKDEFGIKVLDNYALATFKLINKNILIHCYAGAQRSAICVTATLFVLVDNDIMQFDEIPNKTDKSKRVCY